MPTAEFLAQHDIVVNCVLQDTDAPLMFVSEDELDAFRPGSLIVDVSCDLGMGFDCARPTTFEEPMFVVGDGVSYYGVDHSPQLPVEQRDLGHQRGADPVPAPGDGRAGGWDADADHQQGDRDPRRGGGQPQDPVLPGPVRRAPPPPVLSPVADHAGPSARCLMPRSIWRSITKLIGSTTCHITAMLSG